MRKTINCAFYIAIPSRLCMLVFSLENTNMQNSNSYNHNKEIAADHM